MPGLRGRAPTRTSGAFPGVARDATTLWLATVPLLHAALRLTGTIPAVRRAVRAAAIFRPTTFGTATPGCVVAGAVAEVEVIGAAVALVVVKMLRTAFFSAVVGELPHDVRMHAATSAAAPAKAIRPPGEPFVRSPGGAPEGMRPSWFLGHSGVGPGRRTGPATSRC